jgi:hypothetical protein
MVAADTETGESMTETRTDAAAEYAATIAEEVRRLDAALGGDADALATFTEGNDDGEPFGMVEYLNGWALEFRVARYDDGETLAEVLRTYGGPGCRLYRESNNGNIVRVEAYSAGDPVAVLDVWAPNVAAALDELAAL